MCGILYSRVVCPLLFSPSLIALPSICLSVGMLHMYNCHIPTTCHNLSNGHEKFFVKFTAENMPEISLDLNCRVQNSRVTHLSVPPRK